MILTQKETQTKSELGSCCVNLSRFSLPLLQEVLCLASSCIQENHFSYSLKATIHLITMDLILKARYSGLVTAVFLLAKTKGVTCERHQGSEKGVFAIPDSTIPRKKYDFETHF